MAPRTLNRLKPLQVAKLKAAGMYPDGGGLYLQVTSPTAKSWVFRYAVDGRERYCGLGPVNAISIDRARDEARTCREMRFDGIDPIEARNAERQARKLEAAKAMTFDECAAAYITAHESAWTNPVHRQQWRNTLRDYASPVLGALPVQAIDTGLVVKVVEPIWRQIPETASRIRQRIEAVLDWATVRGYRAGDNPARWRGHLDNLLPAPTKVRKVKHHAALPYAELPAFMAELRAREGTAARCLEFVILTAARTGEAIGARWDEIKDGVWTVPSDRMKAGKEHRVPLSKEALAILDQMKGSGSDYVFPNGNGDGLSNMAMLRLLERMERGDLTTHGFRSTFRDWSAERTSYPNHVVEKALAHVVADKVEAAYRRGDLFQKRRRLMADWARYCTSPAPAGEVVSIGGRG
jgi:integrase